MAAHLVPGGVLVVEPWFEPDRWRTGTVRAVAVEGEDMAVCRTSRSSLARPGLSRLRFDYLVATQEGVETRAEVHDLGLFTAKRYVDAAEGAGLVDVVSQRPGPLGRALLIGSAPSG